MKAELQPLNRYHNVTEIHFKDKNNVVIGTSNISFQIRHEPSQRQLKFWQELNITEGQKTIKLDNGYYESQAEYIAATLMIDEFNKLNIPD